tara:strand:- start:4659 stop:4907 length:249 start_codon:yes stop_codon:yes gene_type:complete
MAKKKSYMNTSTLVAEGFFSKLFKKIKDRKTFNKIKKDKEVNKHLNSLNKRTQSMEDRLNKYLKAAGEKPIKLDAYTLKDFL